MPRATVLKTTERKDLTTLPAADGVEGGWVELRRLSYGEKLQKDAEAMKMRFAMGDSMKDKTDINAEVSIVNEIATLLEMQRCVVRHNLTTPVDPNDETKGERPIDFNKWSDMRELDPRVGEEISILIGEMNDFEKDAKSSEVSAEGK